MATWLQKTFRLNENLGQNIGFLNPLLYGPLRQKVMYDVTRGDNTSSHIDRDGQETTRPVSRGVTCFGLIDRPEATNRA